MKPEQQQPEYRVTLAQLNEACAQNANDYVWGYAYRMGALLLAYGITLAALGTYSYFTHGIPLHVAQLFLLGMAFLPFALRTQKIRAYQKSFDTLVPPMQEAKDQIPPRQWTMLQRAITARRHYGRPTRRLVRGAFACGALAACAAQLRALLPDTMCYSNALVCVLCFAVLLPIPAVLAAEWARPCKTEKTDRTARRALTVWLLVFEIAMVALSFAALGRLPVESTLPDQGVVRTWVDEESGYLYRNVYDRRGPLLVKRNEELVPALVDYNQELAERLQKLDEDWKALVAERNEELASMTPAPTREPITEETLQPLFDAIFQSDPDLCENALGLTEGPIQMSAEHPYMELGGGEANYRLQWEATSPSGKWLRFSCRMYDGYTIPAFYAINRETLEVIRSPYDPYGWDFSPELQQAMGE